MELTELSLAPKHLVAEKSNNSSSSESESYTSRKRKFSIFDHQNQELVISTIGGQAAAAQASVDLQVKDPLPLDWERCLDLESGRMYYLNRKTSRKTWNWPWDQKLDLELNISSTSCPGMTVLKEEEESSVNIISCKRSSSSSSESTSSSTSSNMVALACLNCHLLVILSKSSPSCPNCKFVHSLPAASHPRVASSSSSSPGNKPRLSTLSLLR